MVCFPKCQTIHLQFCNTANEYKHDITDVEMLVLNFQTSLLTFNNTVLNCQNILSVLQMIVSVLYERGFTS